METGAAMEYLSLVEAQVKDQVEITRRNCVKTEAIFYVQMRTVKNA